MDRRVAIVIVNYNGAALTLECLQDLRRQTYRNLTICVVDNGSSDGSAEQILKAFPEVTVLETGENLGFARGNNVGIRHCLEDDETGYVLLLNNDTESDPGMLRELVWCLERQSAAAAAGPKIYYFDHPGLIWSFGGAVRYRETVTREIGKGRPDRGQYDQDRPVDFVTSCCMLMRREAIETVGLLDPNYFINVDDADWCTSARDAGYTIMFAHRAKVWHKVAMSTGGSYTPFKTFHSGRSNAIFVRKFAKPLERLSFVFAACIGLALALFRELFRGNASAVFSKARGFHRGWTDPLLAPESLRPAKRPPGRSD